MLVFFLRHGEAEERRPGGSDDDRRLTPEGVRKVRASLDGLRRLRIDPDLVLSSPLARARETAEIVAGGLGVASRLRAEVRLGPGFSLDHLRTLVTAHGSPASIMVVGHEPALSRIAGQLAGGAAIDLKKGGLIVVDTPRIDPDAGLLRVVATPALLGTA